jgi:putative ATP-dependent endonuclease of the OLD family
LIGVPRLIGKIIEKSNGRQLIITIHSSFVLNKLGIENTLMILTRLKRR